MFFPYSNIFPLNERRDIQKEMGWCRKHFWNILLTLFLILIVLQMNGMYFSYWFHVCLSKLLKGFLRWIPSGRQSDSFYNSTAPAFYALSVHDFMLYLLIQLFGATLLGLCKCEYVFVCLHLCLVVAISGLDGGAWWRQEAQATTGRWQACHATSARSGPA